MKKSTEIIHAYLYHDDETECESVDTVLSESIEVMLCAALDSNADSASFNEMLERVITKLQLIKMMHVCHL